MQIDSSTKTPPKQVEEIKGQDPNTNELKLEEYCTDSIMLGDKITQIPFYSNGSYFCK